MSKNLTKKNGVLFDPEILALENADEGSGEEQIYIDYMSEEVSGPCAISGELIKATRCQFWHGKAIAEKYRTGEIYVPEGALARQYEGNDGDRSVDYPNTDQDLSAPAI